MPAVWSNVDPSRRLVTEAVSTGVKQWDVADRCGANIRTKYVFSASREGGGGIFEAKIYTTGILQVSLYY
jgi:hypothetical protein